MISYDHGTAARPLLFETIGARLDRTVAAHGGREALVVRHQHARMTYLELGKAVDALATGLMNAGIARGDRVGIWSPNRVEWVLLQYATAKVGAILVNVNPAYRPRELAYVLSQSGMRLLVSAATFKASDYRAMVDEARASAPQLERAVFIGDPEWAELAGCDPDPEAIARRMARLDPDDPINIQYTSGTTGPPKGATLTHHGILNNAFFVGELLGYDERDRVCVPVPFYHCFGMVMGNLAAMARGACVVVPTPTFEADATLEAVAEERCSSLYGVPTMFLAQLESPRFAEFDLSGLRVGIMAGSPCPIELMRRVVDEMHMPGVSICYGMTETSPVSTQSRADDPLELRVGSVGRVVPHVEIKIVDPVTGHTVDRGERGELCTRGYSVMRGYWDDPERTDEVVDEAGWMHTGDLARMDDEGYVEIVGRIKDMVIRGGENIYPREIEELLYGHPEVVEVQVVGVPDSRYGEELCVWIHRCDGAALDEDAVRSFCRANLAHYKVPRHVLFVDEFPMTVTGKVQKYRMRELSIERLGLDG